MKPLQTLAIALGRISLAERMAGSPSSAFLVGALGGWAVERRAIRARPLAKEARAVVLLKDALVAGCCLSAIAVRLLPKGRLASRSAIWIHKGLVGAAVAATPFINFALFLDYRPEGIRGMLDLWARRS